MTNPNQMREVLLFVCSKMADETNLSSKLPVADRTSSDPSILMGPRNKGRSEEESSVCDAIALAFRCTSIF